MGQLTSCFQYQQVNSLLISVQSPPKMALKKMTLEYITMCNETRAQYIECQKIYPLVKKLPKTSPKKAELLKYIHAVSRRHKKISTMDVWQEAVELHAEDTKFDVLMSEHVSTVLHANTHLKRLAEAAYQKSDKMEQLQEMMEENKELVQDVMDVVSGIGATHKEDKEISQDQIEAELEKEFGEAVVEEDYPDIPADVLDVPAAASSFTIRKKATQPKKQDEMEL